MSSVTQAVRELFGNTSPEMPPPDAWPVQHPIAYSLIWVVVLLVVFVPLSVRRYKNAAGK